MVKKKVIFITMLVCLSVSLNGQSTTSIIYDNYCDLTINDTSFLFDYPAINIVSKKLNCSPKQKKPKDVVNLSNGKSKIRDFDFRNGIVLTGDIEYRKGTFVSISINYEGKHPFRGSLIFYGFKLSGKTTFDELYKDLKFKSFLIGTTDYSSKLPSVFYSTFDGRQSLKFESINGTHYLRKVEIRNCTERQKDRIQSDKPAKI